MSLSIRKKGPWEIEKRCAGFGMAWIFVTLLPTSSFIPLLDPVMEHRTYLPMVGFALLANSIFSWVKVICQNFNSKKVYYFHSGVVSILILFFVGCP